MSEEALKKGHTLYFPFVSEMESKRGREDLDEEKGIREEDRISKKRGFTNHTSLFINTSILSDRAVVIPL